MKARLYTFVHFTSYLTILHGLIYGALKYFFQVETEYGLRPSEYQGLSQSLHIVLSPLLIFSFGLLWKDHIYPKLRRFKEKKLSGTILVISFIFMTLSGYFIQGVYAENPREFFITLHLVTSFVWCVFYLVHHKSNT